MTVNKTTATDRDVATYITTITDTPQRADAETLPALLQRLSGAPAQLWGPGIVGFGSYHYRYTSGREGAMCRIGFAARKGQTVLYIHGD